jgi:hypothetical protein
MNRILISVLGIIVGIGIAQAAPVWHASTVKFVYPQADGSFVLVMDVDPPTCPAAGTGKYLYVVAGQNGMTADGLKAMYALSMQALATRAILQLNFEDASTACYVNRMLALAP